MKALRRSAVFASRSIGFSLAPALSVLTPFFVMPVISRTVGASGILAVLIGQSVGASAGTLVALSWPLSGPTMIARTDKQSRPGVYRESLEGRLLAFLVIGPVSGILAALLVDSYRLTAFLAAIAFAGYGFTSAWYYMGIGSARGLLVYEVLARVIAATVAGLLLLARLPLEIYPVMLILAVLAGGAMNLKSITGSLNLKLDGQTFSAIWQQREATASRFINGIYQSGAASLVAFVSPGSALAFSCYDRTQTSAFNAAISFPQSLIAWVAGRREEECRRQKVAISIDVVFACVVSIGFVLALPFLLRLLYDSKVSVSFNLVLLTSLGLGAAILARSVFLHGLFPMRLDRFAARLLSICSVLGIGVIVIASNVAGAAGALAAVLATELSMSVIAIGRIMNSWKLR